MNALDGKVALITGASGFIGSHLLQRLSRIPGVRLLLLSRSASRPTSPNTAWLQGDLKELSSSFWSGRGVERIDYVFHHGAFIPKSPAEINRLDEAVEDNIRGTSALLKSLPAGVRKVVFASTVDVYAPPDERGMLTETSPVDPRSLYGASKLFCERLVPAWAAERDCEYAILRYGHIYGPGEERFAKLIPLAIGKALSGQAPVVYGDGSVERDYLYVDDAVEATLRAACVAGNVGPLNVVRGESVSVGEVMKIVSACAGATGGIHFLRDKPNGYSLRFDNTLMRTILGTWAMTHLNAGLAAEVQAFRSSTE